MTYYSGNSRYTGGAGGVGSNSGGVSARSAEAHVVLFAAAAALGGFLFGYDTAVINGAVGAIRQRFDIGAGATGLAVSLTLIGAAVGAWIAGSIADRIGRLHVMQIAAIMFMIGAIGSAFPFDIVDLTFWRFVGGIAVGLASVISPAYIAEIAPPNLRGRLGSMHQLAIVLGIAVSALVNYAISAAAGGSAANKIGGVQAWQWMLVAACIPALLYLIMASVIPESPRFLVARGKEAKARKIIEEVQPGGEKSADEEIAAIRASLGEDRKHVRVRQLFTKKSGVSGLVLIGIGLAMLQQLVGINVIFYYSSTLWQAVGFGEDRSLLISMISAIVNIVGTLVAIAVIDKVGRKPLLILGSLGMAISLGTAAWMFSSATWTTGADGAKQAVLHGSAGPIALIAANCFVFFFAFSWGPVVWVLISEIFPNRARAAAVGVATAANWIANFLVSATFPSLADWNLSFAYAMYAIFAVLSLLFVLKFVKETKGRSLESM
jgi:sugar porter (SP) family MFS transporter